MSRNIVLARVGQLGFLLNHSRNYLHVIELLAYTTIFAKNGKPSGEILKISDLFMCRLSGGEPNGDSGVALFSRAPAAAVRPAPCSHPSRASAALDQSQTDTQAERHAREHFSEQT